MVLSRRVPLVALLVVMMMAMCNAQTIEAGTTPETNITYMIQLLQGANLTVPGEELPPVTLAIPNNDAVSSLLQSFGVNIQTALAALGTQSLPAAIQERLNSIILYHIVPSGVLTPAELGAEGDVPTALENYSLTFNADGSVITTPTGTANVVASGESEGAGYLVTDAALLPAEFANVPQTSTEDAQAFLKSLYHSHPSPANE